MAIIQYRWKNGMLGDRKTESQLFRLTTRETGGRKAEASKLKWKNKRRSIDQSNGDALMNVIDELINAY